MVYTKLKSVVGKNHFIHKAWTCLLCNTNFNCFIISVMLKLILCLCYDFTWYGVPVMSILALEYRLCQYLFWCISYIQIFWCIFHAHTCFGLSIMLYWGTHHALIWFGVYVMSILVFLVVSVMPILILVYASLSKVSMFL